jgi:thioredoxin reductase (NADPH)
MADLDRHFAGRREQMFPVLGEGDLARAARFGPVPACSSCCVGWSPSASATASAMWCPSCAKGPGAFLAEVGQLSGAPALVDGIAEEAVEAFLVPPAQLRALITAEADLGERITRALILRRVALIERGATGAVLIGDAQAPHLVRLENFLRRNGQPYHVIGAMEDASACALAAQYANRPHEVLAVCPDGSILVDPDEQQLARCLGLLDPASSTSCSTSPSSAPARPAWPRRCTPPAKAWPSWRWTAARTAARPAPVRASRTTWASRPASRARRSPAGPTCRPRSSARACWCRRRSPRSNARPTRRPVLHLVDGRRLRARAVVVASGARYNRPDARNLPAFEGRGVWYWASPIEARMCRGEQVVLVGGGNSAGQAAVFLAAHAARVTILVRGAGLAATMSRYLIDRIEAAPTSPSCRGRNWRNSKATAPATWRPSPGATGTAAS